MNLKNLKNFKGNKRGAPWILLPVDEKKYSVLDIRKLKPDEVNVVCKLRPKEWFDKNTGKRNEPKKIRLCRVSDLPDEYKNDEQLKFIWQKIKDLETKTASESKSIRTGGETTVKDMLNAYLLSPKVLLEKNHFGKVKHLSFFKDEIGHKYLVDIKPEDIWEAKNKLKLPNPNAKRGDCLSGKTINNYIRTLRSAFDWAKKNYANFELNPVYNVESEVQETFEHRFLTDAERDKLFDVIKRRTSTDKNVNKFGHNVSKELEDFVKFGLWLGSRRGELKALQWENIDFKKQEITFTHAMRRYDEAKGEIIKGKLIFDYKRNVRSKGLKNSMRQRSISFAGSPKVREILRRRWSERSDDYIFTEDCRRAWVSCLKEAEIDNFRFHDLRKTCGSYLYQDDAPLENIAFQLGHKSTNTTEQIYVKKNTEASIKNNKILQKRIG